MNLKFRNFDFSLLGQGALQHSVMLSFGIDSYRTPMNVIFDNRWTETNNNRNAIIPRQTMNPGNNNKMGSDYWLKSADYLRIKSLSVGYTIPKHLLSRVGINQLRFYFAGTNLFTASALTKYNIDPEAPSWTNGQYYPQQRTLTLGLNLTL